ncbi:hypothetical protein FEM48_Zijuj08G0081400 [Ziziphus jujuba var. spinosa]|uniref:Uncharacterized protein n=1 Tax=Ziziphus jujuba var. spinosa TaxID=714518 RepID=A0A978UXY8_ZIZJJ|nr:hypothetical protein FEM48_Zijuj08G0081400 [Ziziphus jujuba var. spinosa]
MTKAILLRFGLTEFDNPSEALIRLRQTTSVAADPEVFERLSHRMDGLPEHFLVGCFIVGLRDDIHLDVKIKNPHTLAETIGVARLVEERNLLQWKMSVSSRPATSAIRTNSTAGVLCPPPLNRTSPAPLSSTPVHRLSNQEALERRDKGLCYYCDEKFISSPCCEQPQLFMLEDTHEPAFEPELDDSRVTELQEVVPESRFTPLLEGIPIIADYYVLPVAACSLVLRVQ